MNGISGKYPASLSKIIRQIALDALILTDNGEALYRYATEHQLTVNEVIYYQNAYEYGGDASLGYVRNPDIIPPDLARRAQIIST